MASAQKKASRTTNEGAVGTYIHAGGKIGVLVEVNCESDFVARTDDFQELLKDIAMHIAATDPRYIRKRRRDRRGPGAREGDLSRTGGGDRQAGSGDREDRRGQDGKFYEEVCLLEQPFIKEQAVSIKDLIAQKVGKLGENITVRRFARFKVGDPNWTVAQVKATEEAQS